jgi:hypothetical protein
MRRGLRQRRYRLLERLPVLPTRALRVSMLYRRSFLAGTFAITAGVAAAQDRRRRPKIGVL